MSRGLKVLDLLTEGPRSASDVAALLGVNRSTGHRLLRELESLGYVKRIPSDRRYGLKGERFFPFVLPVQAEWSELLDSVLQQLRDKSGEAVVFAIPANGGMVYVRFLPSQHPVAIRQGVGSVAPMYASSLGKAWLSELASERLEFELDRIEYSGGTDNAPSGPSELRTELEMTRARGWALDEEESLPGVVCVGAPVWIGEELIGAVAISAPRDRFPVDIAGELGQQLRESVTALQGSTTLVVPSGWG